MSRRKRLTPRHPPRRLLRSAGCPEVWSEQDAAGVTVHAPGVILRAPAACPAPELRKTADRLRAAYLFGGTADRGDFDALAAAAFGDQPLDRLTEPRRLVALAHVLKAWGLSTAWPGEEG